MSRTRGDAALDQLHFSASYSPSAFIHNNTLLHSHTEHKHPTTTDINCSYRTPTYIPHMGDRKKSKGSKSLLRPVRSVSDSNLAMDPLEGRASRQSGSDTQPQQPSGDQRPKQAALPQPIASRSVRSVNKWKSWFSPPPPSPAHKEKPHITTDNHTATSAPQSLAISASPSPRPHSSHPESSTPQPRGPLLHDLSPPHWLWLQKVM